MDGSNDTCFQSVVILGLKTALFEAQDEINRLTRERDEARKKILQLIRANGKYQVEVINSNELATKLKSELKKVRKELEAYKKELEKQKSNLENAQREKENENYNWRFQYDQLKSLLDIKTELLESLNVRGDKINKDDLTDYRANYKMMMKNLKMVVKNQPCYPDQELLEDIQNMIYRIESGKSINLSKYLVKKVKPIKKEMDKCNDNPDDNRSYAAKVHDDSGIQNMSPLASLSNNFANRNQKCSESIDPNVVQNDFSTKMIDLPNLDKSISRNTNLVVESSVPVRDKLKVNAVITDMPNLQLETIGDIISSEPIDKKDIDTISDSESDSTSGFCDGETEAESPPSMELANHSPKTPSLENHTLAMCMPDLLLSSNTENTTFNGRFSAKHNTNDQNTTSKLPILIPNSTLKNNESSPSQKKKPDAKNESEVQKILEEMGEMKNTMNGQVAILKRYYENNLSELNSCFKRPKSVVSSRRKSAQKSRKHVGDMTNVIPKLSSELVERNPCSRKLNSSPTSSADEIRENESVYKLDLGSISQKNEIARDSSKKPNLHRKALDFVVAEKLEVGETFSAENSSSPSNVTSSFEIATEPISELLTEANARDTIDLKSTLNVIDVSLSNDEMTAEKIENLQISRIQKSPNETNYSMNILQINVLENSNMETLSQITLESGGCDNAKSLYTRIPQNDVTNEKKNTVLEECLDNVSSRNVSSSIVENVDEVSTEESNAVTSADISNQHFISAPNVLSQNSIERSPEFSKTQDVKMQNDYSELLQEKLIKTAKTLQKFTKVERVSFIDKQQAPSTCAENNVVTNTVNTTIKDDVFEVVSSSSLQEPVEKSQVTSVSVLANCIDVPPNSDSLNMENEDDQTKVSRIAQQLTDSSTLIPKKDIVILDGSNESLVSENLVRNESVVDFISTGRQAVEDVLKKSKHGHPEKLLENVQNEDYLLKASSETEESANSSISNTNENTAFLKLSEKSSAPEDNSECSLTEESNHTEGKLLEKVRKKRGRPKKASLDVRNKAKTTTKKTIVNLENSKETSVLKNHAKSNVVDDSNRIVEKISEQVSKRRGRSKTASLDSQHTSNESEPEKTCLTHQSTNSSTKSKKNKAILEQSDESLVLENSVNSDRIHSNLVAEKLLESSSKKRKCGRPKKASLVVKSETRDSSTTTEPDSNYLKTVRASRRKSTVMSCQAILPAEDVDPSSTMNNGMERRKRKGKYDEILDSLKCRSKRRKSDQDVVSLELTNDVKLRQRRGCKRKASLPVQTFESATQTNWSPGSETTISEYGDSTPEMETGKESKSEEVLLEEASSQNMQNSQQIKKQTLPSNINTYDPSFQEEISFVNRSVEAKKPRIPIELESSGIVAPLESCNNATDSRLLPSCHLVSSSSYHLPQLLDDMSKIIQEKVLSIVMARSFKFSGENSKDVESESETAPVSSFENPHFRKETVPQNSPLNMNKPEPLPIATEPRCVCNPSLVTENDVEFVTTSSLQNLNKSQAINSVVKSELEHTANLSDLSNEPKHDEKSIVKPNTTTSNLEEIPAAKIAEECVSSLFDSSLECKNDTEYSVRTADQVIVVDELKQRRISDVRDSSIETEKDEDSILKSNEQNANQCNAISFEKSERKINSNSSSELESKIDEGSIGVKTTNQSEMILRTTLKQEIISKSSDLLSEFENIEESAARDMQLENQTEAISITKSDQADHFTSTSKLEKNEAPPVAKSIFESESNEPHIKVEFKQADFSIPKVSGKRNSLVKHNSGQNGVDLSLSSSTDSDDDSPTEMSSKILIREPHTYASIDESSHVVKKERENKYSDNEPTSRVRYEEEASNSSALSSQVSELDVNVELVSQFENVRTPPKIKDLFDSSDDENSKSDVFNIIEEMTSVSRSLLQRQQELVEFSRSSPPLSESAVIPSTAKCQIYSPSRNTFTGFELYSPSQNSPIDHMQIKDDNDSEDETLIIAEDDLVNDSIADGIEINKFNCHDTSHYYASPAYTKSLTSSNVSYNSLSNQITDCNRPTLNEQLGKPVVFQVRIGNEGQTSASNSIKFQFYKENVQLENNVHASRALSPFEIVWENLKSLYVRSPPAREDVMLIPCYQSVTHLAFFYTNKKPNINRGNFSLENDKVTYIEMLIKNYLEHVRENEYVAVKNFKVSAQANPVTIATALTIIVMKNSNRHMKELKETLRYLSNLCVDLETEHKDFIVLLQTTLKEKMFSKTWQVDNNSGTNQVMCIIAMSVLFTMLSQRSNDVKSVKELLLEGLCSWKYRAHPVAFGVLNACPTIFNDTSRNCLLTQIILFTLINHSMERNLDLYKVPDVREMIGQHYKVKLGDKAAEDHVREAMLLFNDDTWVDAIVLLCKRKQFSWSYTNVIMKYLIQIVNKWKEEDFNEMILIKSIQALHKIVQCCPIKAVGNSNKTKKRMPADSKYPTYNIASIIKSLSEVLHCSKGSRELRETVAVAICNISHLDFEVCSNILSKWEPPEGMISNKMLEEMNVIMKRCRILNPNVPNKWLQSLLPKECWPMMNTNRRNFVPRKFDVAGGDSTQQQRQYQPTKFHAKNSAFSEPPKQKKKKNKGKKNRDNREQPICRNSV